MKPIKKEVIVGKVGRFKVYVFPGYVEGDMFTPAFCVIGRVKKTFKGGTIIAWYFTAVMN